MEAWQERVIQEKKELDDKIKKLVEFLDPSKTTQVDITKEIGRLMRLQLFAMTQYSEALTARIALFKNETKGE